MIRRFPLWSTERHHKSSRRSFEHKTGRLLGLGLAMVIVGLLLPARASATIYNPPWADLICNNFGGGNNSLPACQNAYNRLHNTYKTFNSQNVSGAAALGTGWAQSDAIWMAVGHGPGLGAGPRFILTSSSPASAVRASDYCSAPNGCLSTLVSGQKLRYVRLMMFVGCGTDGDLPATAIAAGADAAIAFRENIGTEAANYWVDRFFLHAMQGNTIQRSADWAHEDLLAVGYGDQGLGSIHIWGNNSETLTPARYGV